MSDARLRAMERAYAEEGTRGALWELRHARARVGLQERQELLQDFVDNLAAPFLSEHFVTPCCCLPVAWLNSPLTTPQGRGIHYWICSKVLGGCDQPVGKMRALPPHGGYATAHDYATSHINRARAMMSYRVVFGGSMAREPVCVFDDDIVYQPFPTRLVASLFRWHHKTWPGTIMSTDHEELLALTPDLWSATAESLGDERVLELLADLEGDDD